MQLKGMALNRGNKKKEKKSFRNSSEGLFIHLLQCSSWLFLSFFRRLRSLMIPACLSSVYLTPSGALCGLPPVLAETQSCTDHFILWDKTSLSVSSQALGERCWSSKTETSKGWNTNTGYTWGCRSTAFWLIKSTSYLNSCHFRHLKYICTFYCHA